MNDPKLTATTKTTNSKIVSKYSNLELKYMVLCLDDISGDSFKTQIGFSYHTNYPRDNRFEVFYDTQNEAIDAIAKLGEENRDYTVICVFAKIGEKS